LKIKVVKIKVVEIKLSKIEVVENKELSKIKVVEIMKIKKLLKLSKTKVADEYFEEAPDVKKQDQSCRPVNRKMITFNQIDIK
jgi:hypothetical protein